MTQDGEPFNQEELDEMLEIAVDPHSQNIPYEYYINQLMVIAFLLMPRVLNLARFNVIISAFHEVS